MILKIYSQVWAAHIIPPCTESVKCTVKTNFTVSSVQIIHRIKMCAIKEMSCEKQKAVKG